MKNFFYLSVLISAILFSSPATAQEKTKSKTKPIATAGTAKKLNTTPKSQLVQDDNKKKAEQDTTKTGNGGTRMAISNKGVPTKGGTKKTAAAAGTEGKTENKTEKKTETEKK